MNCQKKGESELSERRQDHVSQSMLACLRGRTSWREARVVSVSIRLCLHHSRPYW